MMRDRLGNKLGSFDVGKAIVLGGLLMGLRGVGELDGGL